MLYSGTICAQLSGLMKIHSLTHIVTSLLALGNAQITPNDKCRTNQQNLATLGVCPGGQSSERYPCVDLCTREYVIERDACTNAAHCCFSQGECVLKSGAGPRQPMDMNEIGRSFLQNQNGHTRGRLLSVGRPTLTVAEIQTLHPGVSILPKFPNSCRLSYTSPEDLEPPVNIPYCQRIACRPSDLFLEFNPMQCLSIPGCAFDYALFTYRNALSHVVLLGVPVCHLAIRNKVFQRLASEYIQQLTLQWNPLLTNCLINQYQKEIYAETPGCSMTRVLGELGRQPKRAGWRGITQQSCHLIGGCWINDICVYALPLQNIKTRSTAKREPNIFSLSFGRHECLPFNDNLINGEFLDAYHNCLASGCSVDADHETVMRHIFGVATTYLSPHLQHQYWTMALLGQVQAHNWKIVADRLINDNVNTPFDILGNISPQNILSGAPISGDGVSLLPFTLRVNTSPLSSLLNSFTTFGSFGQFGNANNSQNMFNVGSRPISASQLNLENFGSLSNLHGPGSSAWKSLQELLSGEGPQSRHSESPLTPPCLYRALQWPNFPPLRGSFQDCCKKAFCYIPRHNLRNAYSEIASYQTDWTTWGPCSRTCGGGEQIRRKFCIGDDCNKIEEEKQPCNFQICPPTHSGTIYSQWSQYSSCSVTCGKGRKRRTRTCLMKRRCRGRLAHSIPCNIRQCPTFRQTSWSRCSTNCGIGVQQRTRQCTDLSASECQTNSHNVQTRACERYCGIVIYTDSPCNTATCLITKTPICITRDGRAGHCHASQMQIKTQRCLRAQGHCRHNVRG